MQQTEILRTENVLCERHSHRHLEANDPNIFVGMIDMCLQVIGILPSLIAYYSPHPSQCSTQATGSVSRTIKPAGLQLSTAKTDCSETQGC